MAVSDKPRKKKDQSKARIVKIDAQNPPPPQDMWFPINWDKVKNINDVKVILKNMGLGCMSSAPGYEELKKYLSDIPTQR